MQGDYTMKNIKGKFPPLGLFLTFWGLIMLFTLCYGIGMKFGNILNAGGFVGVMLSFPAACNLCYRRGYTDGQQSTNSMSNSLSKKAE